MPGSCTFFDSGFDDPGVYVEVKPSPSQAGLPEVPQMVIAIGQRLSTGTKAELELDQIFSDAEAEAYYGRGSMLAEMIKTFRASNRNVELHAMSLDDDVAGAAATKVVTITGTASTAGTLAGYIGGQRVAAAVASGDTETDIAAAWAAAVEAQTDLPVNASPAAGVVTLTCKWKGETGEDIDVRFNYRSGDSFPAAVTATPAAGVTGTSNPDIAPLIAALGDQWFTSWVMPYTDSANLALLKTELARRFGPLVQLEGQAFLWAQAGTVSETVTFLNTLDEKNFCAMGYGYEPEPQWTKAARLAAEEAGAGDPVNVRDKTVLAGMLPPAKLDQLTKDERRSIRAAAGATYITANDGTSRIEVLRTTYKTSDGTIPDTVNYQDIESMRRLLALRYTTRVRMTARFAQTNIADSTEHVAPGLPVVDPATIRGELVALGLEWTRAGWIENLDTFREELIVERDADEPTRVCGRIPPDLTNVLRQQGYTMEFTT